MESKEFMGAIFKASSNGLIKCGEYSSGTALSSGETKLIIIAKDSKPNIKTKFGQLGYKYDVEVITTGTCKEYCWITGKKDGNVLAILDEELAEELKRIHNEGLF